MPVTASVAAGERPATAAALGMALALAGAALACAAHGDDDSRRRGRLVPGAALASVASVGVLDGGANALFAFALTEGLTSTVSVLGSLYPVTTGRARRAAARRARGAPAGRRSDLRARRDRARQRASPAVLTCRGYYESVSYGFVTNRSVIAALEAAVHRVLDHLAAELSDLGLRQADVNLLAQLEPGTPRSVGALAAATGQRPSTLTGVLDRLEQRRLVRRRVNPADRRSFTIELTASGARAAARVHAAFAALDERVLADVPRSAADGFHHVLDALERQTKGSS